MNYCRVHDEEMWTMCCGVGQDDYMEGLCSGCFEPAGFLCDSCEDEADAAAKNQDDGLQEALF